MKENEIENLSNPALKKFLSTFELIDRLFYSILLNEEIKISSVINTLIFIIIIILFYSISNEIRSQFDRSVTVKIN